jgi:hypothetical protein
MLEEKNSEEGVEEGKIPWTAKKEIVVGWGE